MAKVNHILAVNSPYTAEELVATVNALKFRINKYENWCLSNDDYGLCLLPAGLHSLLIRALAIVESLLKAHVESEHYGDYQDNEPADKN